MISSGETQLFTLDQVYSKKFLSATDDERNEDKFVCKKGWVVASDKDGNYTPFFVYVRSKDIVWDQGTIKNLIKKVYGDTYLGVVEMRSYTPGVIEKFRYRDWDVSVNLGTKMFEFRRKINIAESFEINNDDQTDLLYTFKLPIPIISDSDFMITHTMSGNNEQLATSTMNVKFDRHPYNHMIEKVYLHLRNLFYYFHPNFKDLEEYQRSYVYLSISGRNYYL